MFCCGLFIFVGKFRRWLKLCWVASNRHWGLNTQIYWSPQTQFLYISCLLVFMDTHVVRGSKCNFLYKGTLAAFDNGVKMIVMHRCIVSLKYGTETGKFWFTYGSQLLQLLQIDETVSRKQLMLKFLVAEIVVCGFWRNPSVPSRCCCYFLTGAVFPLVPLNLSTDLVVKMNESS